MFQELFVVFADMGHRSNIMIKISKNMNKPFSSNYFGNHVTKTRFSIGSVIFDLLVMTTFKWARLKAAEFGGSSNSFEVIQILSEWIFTKSQSFDLRLQARLSFDAR